MIHPHDPTISRREALILSVLGAAATVGGCVSTGATFASPGFRFRRDLPIPPVLAPSRIDASGAHYEIEQREAKVSILPGLETTAWTYNGIFPGPTIRAKRGIPTIVRCTNKLDTITVVHLHGGRVPSESDGFPTDVILPKNFDGLAASLCGPGTDLSRLQATVGNTRTYIYPNDQRAATLWYHDHCMGGAGRNTYMGLVGFYIIDDDEDGRLPLPRGDHDIPVMIFTRRLSSSGELVYEHDGHMGAGGGMMLVNGAPWPRLAVERRKYRLRFLNADNSEPLELALEGDLPFTQIATDGGLLDAPVTLRTLPLAMAERAEVIIDFAACQEGQSIVLRNLRGNGPLSEVMRFDVFGGPVRDRSEIPRTLSRIERLRPEDAVRTREFVFGAKPYLALRFPPIYWTVNGKRFDAERVDAAPRHGDIEIWKFSRQKTIFPTICHPPHVHLVNFQVLERDGKPPLPHEGGWKDTAALEFDQSVTVIMRFDGYRGRYLLHCHNLEHEDHDMMARFDVV